MSKSPGDGDGVLFYCLRARLRVPEWVAGRSCYCLGGVQAFLIELFAFCGACVSNPVLVLLLCLLPEHRTLPVLIAGVL